MGEKLPSLEQVIRERLFRVADYQRPYAWEKKQLEDLWGDLDLLGTTDHYTGTLVLKDAAEPHVYTTTGEELAIHEIVDGQQRLTTVVILLERLRRAFESLNTEEASQAAARLDELLRVSVDGIPRHRLQLADELDEFFDRCIMGDKPPTQDGLLAGQRRLHDAATFFDSQLKALTDGNPAAESFHRLMEVRKRATHRLKFLVYEVENDAEVGVLFETLNDRGRDLSELEKAKNYLLYLARQLRPGQLEELSKKINAAWADIFANLARTRRDDDTLLRAHWLVTQNSNERSWNGATSLKGKFPRSRYVHNSERLTGPETNANTELDAIDTSLFDEVSTYVESLRMAAVYMRDIYVESPELSSIADPKMRAQIRSRTAALRRSGKVAHFLPILLATRLRHDDEPDKYLAALDLAERFSGRVFAIGGLRSNAGRTTVTWAANGFYQGDWDFDYALNLLREKALQLAPDDEVRQRFAPEQRWYGRPSLKFVLYEYEVAGVRAEDDTIGWEAVTGTGSEKTIEHVLPQNPKADSQWLVDFPDEEQRQMFAHGIGNLVLTRDNSRYSNKDYLDRTGISGTLTLGKRGEQGRSSACYSNPTSLFREREIADLYPKWTADEIEQRRAQIEEWAMTRWHLSAPAVRVDAEVLDEDDAPGVPDDE